jgi:hypothetical protein
MRYFTLLLFFYSWQVSAISRYGEEYPVENVPKVFVIGHDIALESNLNEEYNYSIVSVFNENPQAAFAEWANMLLGMDNYCTSSDSDIRGIKAFATFYWSKDGQLKYVGYALKSNSRYFKHHELEYFFTKYMATHKLSVPKSNTHKFCHSFTLTLPYPREISTYRPSSFSSY